MNKLLIAMTTVLVLSACSPKPDNNSEKNNAEQDSTNRSQTDHSTASDSDLKNAEQPAEAPPIEEFDPKNTMQVELIALIETLDAIAQDAQQKQIAIEEKMHQSTSRADDDAISKMTIELLKEQQIGLQEVPLTEEKLIGIRDTLVESTKLGIEANQDMMTIATPTAEDEQAIVAKFATAQEKSDSAKDQLMEMVKELGMDGN